MKKYIAIGIFAIAIVAMAIGGNAINGFFTKAFDKTLSPGEVYERNITIRKYYNLTVRFQKENSTSYLAFDDNSTTVVLKDESGNELARMVGVVNGRAYFFEEKSQLDRIRTVSAYNPGDYQDAEGQYVNITYSGTTAYINVKLAYKQAMITGYVFDELTGQTVEGVNILAFGDDSDPNLAEPILQNTSTSEGKYLLTLQLNSSKALDIYVRDYDVA